MKRRWHLVAFVLLGAGLAFSLAFSQGWLPNPTLVMRVDAAALSVVVGVLAGLPWLGVAMLHARETRRRAQAQDEIQSAAATERRRFLQRLDHELKNPLTAMRAALVNLAEAPTPEALSSIENQAVRLSRLTANLRKLADLETRPLEYSEVDLTELLEETLALLEERGNGRQMTLNVPRTPWPLPVITGDQDLLFLAFHNLLENAVKFTAEGDTVEVRAFEDGAHVIVEVADTGPGIAANDLPHVWEELFRGRAARGIPGSGLGLSLVRAIIMRHQGEVALRSREGRGTVVSVRLPVAG